MREYDNYLDKLADEYYSGCEPKIVRKWYQPMDDSYVLEPMYNREECSEEDCEHWKDFH